MTNGALVQLVASSPNPYLISNYMTEASSKVKQCEIKCTNAKTSKVNKKCFEKCIYSQK